MRSKKERESDHPKPDSYRGAAQSLGTHPPHPPCPTSSGLGCIHGTSTTPDGLDIYGSGVVGLGCSDSQASVAGTGSAPAQDDVAGVIGTVSWMDHTGMRVELNFLPAWDAGPRRHWVRQMLVGVLRGSDSGDGGCSAVREPAVKAPALGSGGAEIVVSHAEVETVSGLSVA